jgi:hypothetical protein
MPQQDSLLPLQGSRKHLLIKWKPSSPSTLSYLAKLRCSLHQHQVFFLLLQYLPPWSTSTNPSSFGIRNPQEVQPSLPLLKHNTHNISPKSDTPAIIDYNSDNDMPIPIHNTCPPCHHNIHPLQNCPLTRNQLWLCTAHVINCIIADKFMPTPSLSTHQPFLHCRYAFAAQSILLETISPPSHSTIHVIGAIIDKNTGDVLKY